MNFKILLRLFFFIGYCGFISAQVRLSSKTEEKLIKELNSNAHKPAYQQIYLQTDKDIYDLGDDLWFKTYHIDTHTRTLDNSSKILYVQLVNTDTEEVLASQKHEIVNGISKGHIFIPRNVKVSVAPSHGLPVTEYSPRSKGSQSYQNLAKEMVEINDRA